MSKLDRQLDEINGEKRIEITWPFTESMYLEQLRSMLLEEIDAHRHRVPLDLRKVVGAPEPLIELLFELQEYATSQGKQLVIAYASQSVRSQLDPKTRRLQSASNTSQKGGNAGEVAREALSQRLETIQSFHHLPKPQEKAGSSSTIRLPRWSLPPRLKRLAMLLTYIVVGTIFVVALEWYYMFYLADRFRIAPPERPANKMFE